MQFVESKIQFFLGFFELKEEPRRYKELDIPGSFFIFFYLFKHNFTASKCVKSIW